MTTIDELRDEVEQLEQTEAELREWLDDRPEAEIIERALLPRPHGGSGLGTIQIKVSKPGRPVYYAFHPGQGLMLSRHHDGRFKGPQNCPETVLRRGVEYYPKMMEKLVERINDARTKLELSLESAEEEAPEVVVESEVGE